MRRRDVRPMSVSMRGAKKRADSVVGGSAAVCLPPSPHLILFSHRRGDESTAVTHVECICHRTKRQSVQPSAPIWRHFLSACQQNKEVQDRGSCWRPFCTHIKKFSCCYFFFFVIIPSFLAAIFFLSLQNHEGIKAGEGECDAGRRSWELIVPSKRVNLYS